MRSWTTASVFCALGPCDDQYRTGAEAAVDLPTAAQVDAGAVENFRAQYFLLLSQFLSSAALRALRSNIAGYLAAGDTTQVYYGKTKT